MPVFLRSSATLWFLIYRHRRPSTRPTSSRSRPQQLGRRESLPIRSGMPAHVTRRVRRLEASPQLVPVARKIVLRYGRDIVEIQPRWTPNPRAPHLPRESCANPRGDPSLKGTGGQAARGHRGDAPGRRGPRRRSGACCGRSASPGANDEYRHASRGLHDQGA